LGGLPLWLLLVVDTLKAQEEERTTGIFVVVTAKIRIGNFHAVYKY
jgi:hypothetical protein